MLIGHERRDRESITMCDFLRKHTARLTIGIALLCDIVGVVLIWRYGLPERVVSWLGVQLQIMDSVF